MEIVAELFSRSIENRLQKPAPDVGNGSWIDETNLVAKNYNDTRHSTFELALTKAFSKKEWNSSVQKLFRFGKKKTPKLIRMNELGLHVIKKWRSETYTVTQLFEDINARYSLIFLPERNNEALLRRTELTMKKQLRLWKKWVLVLWRSEYGKILGQQFCGKFF